MAREKVPPDTIFSTFLRLRHTYLSIKAKNWCILQCYLKNLPSFFMPINFLATPQRNFNSLCVAAHRLKTTARS